MPPRPPRRPMPPGGMRPPGPPRRSPQDRMAGDLLVGGMIAGLGSLLDHALDAAEEADRMDRADTYAAQERQKEIPSECPFCGAPVTDSVCEYCGRNAVHH